MSRGTKVDIGFLVAYMLLIPIAFLLGWIYSVAFVALLSLVALVESRYAAVKAGRVKDALEEHESDTGSSSEDEGEVGGGDA